MSKVTSYKIAWNTTSDEGVFILDTPDGIQQVLVDSAAEAMVLLTKLRHEGMAYFHRGVVYVANEELGFPAPVSHEYVMPEGVEIIAQQVSWVIPEKQSTAAAASPTPTKAPKKETKAKISSPTIIEVSTDKLRLIEGIGPKIEGLLHEAGILTFVDLATAKQAMLKDILDKAGSRYRMHDPRTWGEQAALAADGKMKELKAWQKELKGGKKQ